MNQNKVCSSSKFSLNKTYCEVWETTPIWQWERIRFIHKPNLIIIPPVNFDSQSMLLMTDNCLYLMLQRQIKNKICKSCLCNFYVSSLLFLSRIFTQLFIFNSNFLNNPLLHTNYCKINCRQPEKMSPNNSILRMSLGTNNIEINGGCVCCQNAMWRTSPFNISKYWLFKCTLFNNSLQHQWK